ncbi:hypothetical protein HMI54_013969 [Coelomomyces lativittatus]|nr:hypothetical protein HMI54_013969 [Coelomomyces lativittatus]
MIKLPSSDSDDETNSSEGEEACKKSSSYFDAASVAEDRRKLMYKKELGEVDEGTNLLKKQKKSLSSRHLRLDKDSES